jgi:hypothetical protein
MLAEFSGSNEFGDDQRFPGTPGPGWYLAYSFISPMHMHPASFLQAHVLHVPAAAGLI